MATSLAEELRQSEMRMRWSGAPVQHSTEADDVERNDEAANSAG